MNKVRPFQVLIIALFFVPYLSQAQLVYQEVLAPTSAAADADIIVEADVYTPNFYAGRAEPVPGGPTRLTAIVRGANPAHASSLLYYWTIDNRVFDSGKAQRQSIKLLAPNANEFSVRVRIITNNGELITDKSEIIELSEPFVAFYEVNPLRGLSHNAINDTLLVTGDEATIEASPYFIDTLQLPAILEWSVNGTLVPSSGENAYQLILSKSGLSPQGTAIDFYAASKNTLGLTARAKLTATLGL